MAQNVGASTPSRLGLNGKRKKIQRGTSQPTDLKGSLIHSIQNPLEFDRDTRRRRKQAKKYLGRLAQQNLTVSSSVAHCRSVETVALSTPQVAVERHV